MPLHQLGLCAHVSSASTSQIPKPVLTISPELLGTQQPSYPAILPDHFLGLMSFTFRGGLSSSQKLKLGMSTQYFMATYYSTNTELPSKGPQGINKQPGSGEKNGSAMFRYEKKRGFLNEM